MNNFWKLTTSRKNDDSSLRRNIFINASTISSISRRFENRVPPPMPSDPNSITEDSDNSDDIIHILNKNSVHSNNREYLTTLELNNRYFFNKYGERFYKDPYVVFRGKSIFDKNLYENGKLVNKANNSKKIYAIDNPAYDINSNQNNDDTYYFEFEEKETNESDDFLNGNTLKNSKSGSNDLNFKNNNTPNSSNAVVQGIRSRLCTPYSVREHLPGIMDEESNYFGQNYVGPPPFGFSSVQNISNINNDIVKLEDMDKDTIDDDTHKRKVEDNNTKLNCSLTNESQSKVEDAPFIHYTDDRLQYLSIHDSKFKDCDRITKKLDIFYKERQENFKSGQTKSRYTFETNLFKINVLCNKIFRYNVDISEDPLPRGLRREMFLVAKSHIINRFGDFVYDGKSTLYTTKKLPCSDFYEFNIRKVNNNSNCVEKITVKIFYEKEISLNVSNKNISKEVVRDVTYALDTIMTQTPAYNFMSFGNTFFSSSTNNSRNIFSHFPLGEGKEAKIGFGQFSYFLENGLYLNVDLKASVFYEKNSLINFIANFLNVSVRDLLFKLSIQDICVEQLNTELKNTKIELRRYDFKRKYKIKNIVRTSAYRCTFYWEHEGEDRGDISVFEYYKVNYGILLKYPNLPLINVGSGDRKTYLPIELCFLKDGQKSNKRITNNQACTLIKKTAKKASERKQYIERIVDRQDIGNDNVSNRFGISLDRRMTQVEGIILKTPKIKFGNMTSVFPINGTWDMKDKKFFSLINLQEYAIVNCNNSIKPPSTVIDKFIAEFKQVGQELGYVEIPNPFIIYHNVDESNIQSSFEEVLKENINCQLIFFILPKKSNFYGNIKRLGDTIYNIPTQCLTFKTINSCKKDILSNLFIKINMKLRGQASNLDEEFKSVHLTDDFITIGIHNDTSFLWNDYKIRVITIVAMNYGENVRTAVSTRVQLAAQCKVEAFKSMIKEVISQLIDIKDDKWKDNFLKIMVLRNKLPQEFSEYLTGMELAHIREACKELNNNIDVAITYVKVNKWHHFKVFGTTKNTIRGKNDNVAPGTVIDNTITSILNDDIYLVSHFGTQGTSRPCHYDIIHNDLLLTKFDIAEINYQLCHTMPHCTRSVSLPSPIYLAINLAARCKIYLKNAENVHDELTSEQPFFERVNEIVAIPQKWKSINFFM
uniref:PAZ domain-containing protein n=1 Tax=Parastrongyloides trichosuri TaxID=131310 RepID=A0A0N4ZSQ4_PARTI